jgi:EpsI family protein
VLAAFAVACAVTYYISFKPVQAVFDADLNSLPMRLDSWQGRDLPLDAETRKILGADEVISRSYGDDLPDDVSLLVVYRKYGRRDFAHRPEMCFPASGYEIVAKRHAKVPYGGRDIDAMQVVAQKGDERVLILYWFASGGKTEANFAKQQLWMALDRLTPHKFGWAFIRLTCPVYYSDEDTMRRVRGFMSTASRPLEDALTKARDRDSGARR